MVIKDTQTLNRLLDFKKAQLVSLIYMQWKAKYPDKKFWYDAAMQKTQEISKLIKDNNINESTCEAAIWEEARAKAIKGGE